MKMKYLLKVIIHNVFQDKNGSMNSKYITLGFHMTYSVINESSIPPYLTNIWVMHFPNIFGSEEL